MAALPDADTLASTVTAQVEQNLDAVLTDIATLVNLDSPTFDVPLLDATAEATAGIARRLGLHAELLPATATAPICRRRSRVTATVTSF